MVENEFPIWPLYMTMLFGALYLSMGVIELLTQFGILIIPLLGNDPFSSLMLLIVGCVFMTGIPSLAARKKDGYAFTLVGATLGAILFILRLLELSSNALGWVLGFQEWSEWSVLHDMSASIWIFLLLMLTYVILRFSNRLDSSSKIFPNGGR